MDAYVTARQMAAYFSISEGEVYIIMHEMETQKKPGLLRIGRLLRARPKDFEDYLVERMKGDNNDLQREITV